MTGISLRTKILISIAGLIVLFGLGAALYGYNAVSGMLMEEVKEKGARMGRNLAVQSSSFLLVEDTFSLSELFDNNLSSDSDVRYIFVESASGALSYQTFEKGMPAGLRQINNVVSDQEQNLKVINTNEGKVLDVATSINEGKDGTLRLGLSFARYESLVNRYVYYVLLLLGLAVVVALLISGWLVRLLTKPVFALSAVTDTIAQGNLSLKAHEGKDEIGRLGAHFNSMTNKLSLYRDELLGRNRELTLLNEQHVYLLKQVIQVQEEERKRIARGLHDEVSQVLSRIAVILADAEEKGYDSINLAERLSTIKGEANYALQSLRETILDLRPAVLDDLGLIPALRWYGRERLEKAGVDFRVEAKGITGRLDPRIEITLFRVIQEAINNIEKHAKAKEASIHLAQTDGHITAEIQDNGVGFDLKKTLYSSNITSFGLLGMKERVMLIDGTFKISSTPGRGTQIHVDIPDMKK